MMVAIQIGLVLLIVLGTGVILLSRSVVHAAYALALALIGVAGVYVLMNAELLAVVQILLYAGGVVILLAFGIMMSNRLKDGQVLSGEKNQVLAAVISLGLLALLSFLISTTTWSLEKGAQPENQIEHIGVAFLTDHIVAFELIAFVLLVALVGAAYLAKKSTDE